MTTTRHQAISRHLRERIQDGTYPPGSKIPAIPALMEEFGVARDTVRDAVARLANEGLVTPLQGIGTVVRDTTNVEMVYRPDRPAQIWSAQTGEQEDSDRVVQAGWETAASDITGWLQVPDRTQVLHRIRHQRKGGQIAQIHEQWIPDHVARAIQDATGDDLADINRPLSTDLFSQMRTAGNGPATVTETTTARMPDPDEASVLELPPGVPVLVTWRVTRNGQGQPVETSVFVGAADRLSQSYTVPV